MLELMESFDGHDVFFITAQSVRTAELSYRKYLMRDVSRRTPVSPFLNTIRIAIVYAQEKPDAVVAMGAGIALPAILAARLLGIHTIFIESLCRIDDISITAKAVLPLSNVFLVQWEELLPRLPEKAKYWGRII